MKRKIPETYEQDSRSVTYGPHTIGITVHTIRSRRGRRLRPYETVSTPADDCVLVWSRPAFIVAVRVTGVATVCIVSAVKRTGAAVAIAHNPRERCSFIATQMPPMQAGEILSLTQVGEQKQPLPRHVPASRSFGTNEP